MAKQRKPDPREAIWAEGRQATADFLRAAEGGVEHTAKVERWDNQRKAAVWEKLIRAARSLTSRRKDGSRVLFEEHGEVLPRLAAAVAQADAAADAKAAHVPEPVVQPAEVAEEAQAPQPSRDRTARRAAVRLFRQTQPAQAA